MRLLFCVSVSSDVAADVSVAVESAVTVGSVAELVFSPDKVTTFESVEALESSTTSTVSSEATLSTARAVVVP